MSGDFLNHLVYALHLGRQPNQLAEPGQPLIDLLAQQPVFLLQIHFMHRMFEPRPQFFNPKWFRHVV